MRASAVAAAACGTAAAMAQGPTIIELDLLPSPGLRGGEPRAINADGSVVVGWSHAGASTISAVRWNAAGNVEALFDDGVRSLAFATNQDGRYAFGEFRTRDGQRAFRWSEGTGREDLGVDLPSRTRVAWDASADGRVAVGDGGTGTNAWWWREGEGMETLDMPGWDNTTAKAVSADGTIVVGSGWRPGVDEKTHPYRWTQAAGAEDLGVPEPWASAEIRATSDDAGVIIGELKDADGRSRTVYRWTEAGGYVELAVPDGLYDPFLFQLSDDGAIAVGEAVSLAAGSRRPIFWTEATGMVDLQAYLESTGVDLSGWDLIDASAISGDGTAIAGKGNFEDRGSAFLITGLRLPGSCRVDLNGDGMATVFDFLAFQNLFEAGDPRADFDADGALTILDFLAFRAAFDTGCA
ncbi:MAG: hypothetical protein NCW75_10015 [Phycisphaera sp.]|nr:MAG: hypothetical protein NCW75_10015 [Phycisphaera sp.]